MSDTLGYPGSRPSLGWILGAGNMRYAHPFIDIPQTAPETMPTTFFVEAFRQIRPHVLCVQEAMEGHVADMSRRLNMPYAFFSPMHHFVGDPGPGSNRLGVLILSSVPFLSTREDYYAGFDDTMPANWLGFNREVPMSSVYQEVVVRLEGSLYTIGNTHFTLVEGLSYPPPQQAALDRLVRAICPGEPVIWCADTNMRRDGPGWDRLREFWIDNTPPGITTTFDPVYSRAAANGFEAVIDGIFSTPEFQVSNVRLHSGVSDHQAFSARVRPMGP